MTETNQQSWDPEALLQVFRSAYLADESTIAHNLLDQTPLTEIQRLSASQHAAELVTTVRESSSPRIMSSFLSEYGLTSQEGIALMCLAEALLRVPDTTTIDTLISDKISAAHWGKHLGHSSSSLVNASTWTLLLTGKILKEADVGDVADTLRRIVKRLGEPVVRVVVAQAIRKIADQFILGTTIESATERGEELVCKGYGYSYDMLGESALTADDAKHYWSSYFQAIEFIAGKCSSDNFWENPGISVKLSALHPRYQSTQRKFIVDELVDSILSLVQLAKKANMGFNIDAEEADTQDLYLEVFERTLSNPSLKGWHGFGSVVQAYSPRARFVIDCLYGLAEKFERRIMLRLVKGAYWDTEIKRAQVLGISSFPVFTRKCSTDLSYLACARRLLDLNDRIYPQFATHNAHTICAVMAMTDSHHRFEFQRLHGMGEDVHEAARKKFGCLCRIYAPVGAREDLLAYLVRRILENGANSSFLNQLVDSDIPVGEVASDPIEKVRELSHSIPNPSVRQPSDIFGDSRTNSKGIDLADVNAVKALYGEMEQYRNWEWHAGRSDLVSGPNNPTEVVHNPAHPRIQVGTVIQTESAHVNETIERAQLSFKQWSSTSASTRSELLNRIADAYEKHSPELIALMVQETGKTIADSISEVREAVDFCRYYANEAIRLERVPDHCARGVIACISPWNFPLAIFTGQISASLAAGNSVIGKPAEQSSLTGARAVELMHQVGIPKDVVQFLPGYGETVGAMLSADERISGICFTGSTDTAQAIYRAMANSCDIEAPLIAETGGLNAMIVDSTALPEQAVKDVIASAFQSAGQRCSALRILYVQNEMESRLLNMLFGAMEQLRVGDPWDISTDVGPIIDEHAQSDLLNYCNRMKSENRLLYQRDLSAHLDGYFVPPSVFRVSGIEELEREIFGPVLHVATYDSRDISKVVEGINKTGYGLTFGLHTRIDRRVKQLSESVNAGNIYVNRNQIGAVVGSQPFGGRGLSGTGPKAGGPYYVARLRRFGKCKQTADCEYLVETRGDTRELLRRLVKLQSDWACREDRIFILNSAVADRPELLEVLAKTAKLVHSPIDLEGPTGESNRIYLHPKGVFICIGSDTHVLQALATGNAVLGVGIESQLVANLQSSGIPILQSQVIPDSATVTLCSDLAGITVDGCPQELLRAIRLELASRQGAIIQLTTDQGAPWLFLVEKSVCIDTTAAGGNARLFIESGS